MPVRSGAVLVASVLALGVVTPSLKAQAPSFFRAFEVASIKTNKSGAPRSRGTFEAGGRYTLTNITAHDMLLAAFEITESQLIDAPGWTSEERFDIAAKMPVGSFDGQTGPGPQRGTNLMLKTLLEERFHLKAHEETRELQEGALALARADGKLGPQLKPASADDTNCQPSAPVATGMDPFKGVAPCGYLSGPSSRPGKRRMVLRGGTLDQLAIALRGLDMLSAASTVLNETGLSGAFNIDLEYEPLPPSGVPDPAAAGPLLSTALADQLGLKVVMRKRPAAVTVIDHIERPTEN